MSGLSGGGGARRERSEARAAWGFLAPALAAITAFFALPLAAALLLSLTDFDIYAVADLGNARFVGLRNYLRLLADPLFWTVLRNTVVFVVLGVPLTLLAALGGALLVHSRLARLPGLYRTVFFAPVVTTLVAVAVVWRYLYHPRFGLIDHALGLFGVPPIDWLGHPWWAMVAITLLAVWRTFGYGLVIFVVGLEAIPEALYEAAALDGAGGWRRFRDITLPQLRPTALFVAVLVTVQVFQIFAEPYVMTRGGPLHATTSITLLMYEQGFRWWNMGHAAAIAFVLFALILATTGLQVALRRRGEGRVRRPAALLAVNAVLAVLALLTAAPILWMVSASFMADGEAASLPLRLVPEEPTLEHYRVLFARLDFARALGNSLFLAVAITGISLVCNSMAGYAFAKLRFRGRDRLFALLVATLVVPPQVTVLPLFLELRFLGLVNTFTGILVAGIATVFGIFLVRQFALGIPDDLLDAARIDGASEPRIYWTIVLPLLRPILLTLGVFTFLTAWNDFMWPLIVLTEESKYTLPVAIANLSGEHVQDTELMMAGAVVTVMPALVLFLALQRYYVSGILMGGVKE